MVGVLLVCPPPKKRVASTKELPDKLSPRGSALTSERLRAAPSGSAPVGSARGCLGTPRPGVSAAVAPAHATKPAWQAMGKQLLPNWVGDGA